MWFVRWEAEGRPACFLFCVREKESEEGTTRFFALFDFNVRSLQDWEQDRRRPEIPIRAYLAVIKRKPQAVIRALRAA